jgi:hypothetical protein
VSAGKIWNAEGLDGPYRGLKGGPKE